MRAPFMLLLALLVLPDASFGIAPGLPDSAPETAVASISVAANTSASASPFPAESSSTASEATGGSNMKGSTTSLLVIDILVFIFLFVASPLFFIWNHHYSAPSNQGRTRLELLYLAITALPAYFSNCLILIHHTDRFQMPAWRNAIESNEDFGKYKAYLAHPLPTAMLLLACIFFGISLLTPHLDLVSSAFIFFFLVTNFLYGKQKSYEGASNKKALKIWVGAYLFANICMLLFLIDSGNEQAEAPLVLAFLIQFFFGLRPVRLTFTLEIDPHYTEIE